MSDPHDDLEAYRKRVGSTLLGKWRIDSLIGVGGMAAVYAATHKIGRRDAIKILLPETAVSKEMRARFEQEALAVSQLGHPATVQVFDIDMTPEGAPFMAMELLEGESLGQRVHRLGGMSEAELLSIVRVVLEVLQAAHDRGIVHRDIKPDNIFITSAGAVKVLDFGIARMKAGSNVRTRTGAMLGTTPYMPPEQITGADVDGRADIFAVGATMFRILAKRRIHEAQSDAELLIRMGTEHAPPLSSVAPTMSREVARIVDTALAFEASRRYPSALAMRQEIESVLHAGSGVPTAVGHYRHDAGQAPAPLEARTGAVRFGSPESREMGRMVQDPTMLAMAPVAAPRSSSSNLVIIAVVVSLLIGVGATAAFFFLRDDPKASTSRDDDDDDDAPPTKATTPSAARSAPSATASSAPPTATARFSAATLAKYRVLEKKGGYLFCVVSELKYAYPVKTEDGEKVCSGTPDGSVPIGGLKKYDVAQQRW